MSAELSPLLRSTLDALSTLDANRLERLGDEAEVLANESGPLSLREHENARVLQHTLAELLRNTDANLRLLRELRETRGYTAGEHPGDAPWGL